MKIITYALLHLKRMIKSKSVLIGALIAPVLVITLIVFFTSGKKVNNETKIYLNIVNKDSGTMGAKLINNLEASPNIKITPSSLEEAEKNVKNNTVSLAVIIPADFTEQLQQNKNPLVKTLKLQQSNMNVAVETRINSFINKNLLAEKLSSDISSSTQYKISKENLKNTITENLKNERVKTVATVISKDGNNSLPSTLCISLMIGFLMYTMISIVEEIIALKSSGTLRRSLSTPNKNITIAASIVLAFLFLGWLQLGLIILITKLIFKLSWGSSPISLFLILNGLLLVILSMGLLISRFIKDRSSAAVIVNLIVSVTCAVSGCFVPLNLLPDFFKKLALFTPQNWALTGLSEVVLKNNGITTILPNLGILLLFTLAFFTAGASSLKAIAKE